ncbi:MAG TPA: endolytic transglycosylase MltG [Desulfomonilaceae bacterium]|nr:endolytic transglycosylase MltG [Desulfomonilaceae bacterium]
MRVSLLSILRSLVLTLVLIGLVIGGYMAYNKAHHFLEESTGHKPDENVAPGREVIVTIPKGASLSQVATILQDNGIVSNRMVFKIVAWIRGEQRGIKAGDYSLKTGSDASDVLDQLISGKTLMLALTIPEGYNIFQIAELFQQMGLMTRSEFLSVAQDKAFLRAMELEGQSLEGYLFPDTYFFKYSEKNDGKLVIQKLVQRFHQVYDKYVRAAAEESGWTMKQVVTLASLVEKEARPSEHEFVSAVFHNRLRHNMRLQSDPTVIYGVKPMGSKITRADLDRKQPYNTYQIDGLPPGPIASPGRESLIAAVKPADVDYLYFVAKNDGSHQFSSNLAEHNRWVNLYQRQPRTEMQ